MRLKGKKVLVTGADGFIGSHLVEALTAQGCKVKALALYNSFNDHGWLDVVPDDVKEKIDIVFGDVRDAYFVKSIMNGVDFVFHLAALIAIPFSYVSPANYVATNVNGTLNVLEAAKELGTKRIFITSTSEVYGTAQYTPIDEIHPLQAQSPYAATKIAADKLGESFIDSYDMPLTIVRPFNTYGPRQSARAIIPTIITQLLNKFPSIELGNLAPVRDFNYVKDITAGFLRIAESERTIGETINISSQQSISIGELAKTLVRKIHPRTKIVCDKKRIRPGRSEVMVLRGCNAKIRKLTTWEPRYDLDTGLDETIAWFRDGKNLSRYKADRYNV